MLGPNSVRGPMVTGNGVSEGVEGMGKRRGTKGERQREEEETGGERRTVRGKEEGQ